MSVAKPSAPVGNPPPTPRDDPLRHIIEMLGDAKRQLAASGENGAARLVGEAELSIRAAARALRR